MMVSDSHHTELHYIVHILSVLNIGCISLMENYVLPPSVYIMVEINGERDICFLHQHHTIYRS